MHSAGRNAQTTSFRANDVIRPAYSIGPGERYSNGPNRRQRFFASLTPMRRPSTVAERQILEEAQAGLDFPILEPGSLPLGYRLVGVDMMEHCRAIVTFNVRRSKDWMRLTQRVAELPLEAELNLTQQPYSQVCYRGKTFLVIAGAFMGEPSDGRWHSSRRSVAWEHAGRICELQQIIATSVPLATALRIAASCKSRPR